MDGVIVLHTPLAGQARAPRDDALLERLPYAYRLALERRSAAGRMTSLEGIRLLAHGFAQLRQAPLDPSLLCFPDGGKPHVPGGPWFSIAHSAARVAVALAEQCELGIDVEDLAARSMDPVALERWTATEAALKAIGAGVREVKDVVLADDLASATFAGQRLYLRPLALAPDCAACLATRQPVARVIVEEFRH